MRNESLRSRAVRWSLTSALALAALFPVVAAAQESTPLVRHAGPYELTVSYLHTPPLVEVDNALVVEVRDMRSGAPVTGLERSLRLEAWVTPPKASARSVFVTLRPARARPGVYEGVFVPPSVGEYTFRLTGQIDAVRVDETFRSGPGGLPSAEPAETDYSSPGAYLAWGLLAVYLVGLGALGVWRWRLRRRSDGPAPAAFGSGV